MKRLSVIFGVLIAAVIILYVWSEFDRLNAPVDPKTLTKQSVLIVYAVVDRDGVGSPLVVQEVWKDERKTNSPLIGTAISPLNVSSNQMPDGAIVFFSGLNSSDMRTYFAVWNGRVSIIATNGEVGKMALEAYKKDCGLP